MPNQCLNKDLHGKITSRDFNENFRFKNITMLKNFSDWGSLYFNDLLKQFIGAIMESRDG